MKENTTKILLSMFHNGLTLGEALCGDVWCDGRINGTDVFVQIDYYNNEVNDNQFAITAYEHTSTTSTHDNVDFSNTTYYALVTEKFIRNVYSMFEKMPKLNIDNAISTVVYEEEQPMVGIPKELYDRLNLIGLIPNKVNTHNVGKSDYAEHVIQPWHIFNDHSNLNYQECDIIKRILRSKEGERMLDLEKCKHILDELIRKEEFKERRRSDER